MSSPKATSADCVLEIDSLCKDYPSFHLSSVTFSVPKGRIMGFVGRNGAGKTTTLKAALNLVHPSGGRVRYFGMDFAEHEAEIKRRIGFSGTGMRYFDRKKIKDIARITGSFYPDWDQDAWLGYLRQFELDESKCPRELSEGMKVKFRLAMALSHHAELLILDEPTSGLDPFARDDLTDLFLRLRSEGIAILFSTHLITDLEKCADDITYIRGGVIRYSGSKEELAPDGELEKRILAMEKEAAV